jgi:5-formyltetrahydrofolate cyclo-ligase
MKANPKPSEPPSGRPKRYVDPLRAQWRRDLRAARDALTDRPEREARLLARIERWLQSADVTRLAFFWPTRGEPDLAALVAGWLQVGPSRIAGLPVIEDELLRFAPWSPGVALVSGPFDIQVPDTQQRIDPQLLLIPCVGIDPLRYRLGYGGGYYDRTLAAMSPHPITVGVGFDCARIETIDPKPHDLRLDVAMTESGAW